MNRRRGKCVPPRKRADQNLAVTPARLLLASAPVVIDTETAGFQSPSLPRVTLRPTMKPPLSTMNCIFDIYGSIPDEFGSECGRPI